jgi:hypothetical protein
MIDDNDDNDTFEWPDENDRDTTTLDGLRLNGDNYTRLAECMECHPNEVSRLIQQHAPWNGKAACDDALRERAAVVAWLRGLAADATSRVFVPLSRAKAYLAAADDIERGEHRREEGP